MQTFNGASADARYSRDDVITAGGLPVLHRWQSPAHRDIGQEDTDPLIHWHPASTGYGGDGQDDEDDGAEIRPLPSMGY